MKPGDNAMPIRIMTVGELAEYLKVHRDPIYRIAREGKLPAFKIDTNWRFDRDAIEKGMTDRQAKRR
jgi:excisionase family DNA binding protein